MEKKKREKKEGRGKNKGENIKRRKEKKGKEEERMKKGRKEKKGNAKYGGKKERKRGGEEEMVESVTISTY